MGEGHNKMFHWFPSGDEDDVELRQSSSSSDSDEDSPLPDFKEEEAASPDSSPSLAETTFLPPEKTDSKGPLNEVSSLMMQLPIKRGLSKYYQGKSQSYSSLSDVRCLADLPKKVTPYERRMKSCKSYAGGLDGSPKCKTISKKASGGSCASSIARSSSRPPSIPVRKNLCLH